MAEEQTIHRVVEQHIQKNTTWEALPSSARQLVGQSKEAYNKAVVTYALRHQWRWRDTLVQQVLPDERVYYEELLKLSSKQFMLYPYHLADVLVKGLRVTPFRYYWDVMYTMMSDEKSYDALPNFTAADGVRLLGIGRNQYIDIMNKCRQKSWSQFFNKKQTTIRQLLPTAPIDIDIEYWWVVNVGYVSEDDAKVLPLPERRVIDELINAGPMPAGHFKRRQVQSLYKRGLIFLNVPIEDDDQIIVPPLEGFVMNRVLGDYLETLLYKIFVSIDERTAIHELATLLQVDVHMVKLAVSLYIRLGFAKKKNVVPLQDLVQKSRKGFWSKTWYQSVSFSAVVEASDNTVSPMRGRMPGDVVPPRSPATPASATTSRDPAGLDASPQLLEFDSPVRKTAATGSDAPAQAAGELAAEVLDAPKDGKRIGLVLDATITAFLMMGNLAPGLKSHAVTLFEVGKLADEALGSFLAELDTVDQIDHQAEGEAERYFQHAITLRETIRFLRSPDNKEVNGWDHGLDLLRCERLESLDRDTRTRILNKNYALLVSMSPISHETPTITSCIPRHFGPAIAEVNSGWFSLFALHCLGRGVPSIAFPRGHRVRTLPPLLQRGEQFLVTQWGHDPSHVAATNLLTVLSDALLVSPVLVQLLSTDRPEHRSAYLPFPLVDDDSLYSPLQLQLRKYAEVERLRCKMDLEHSFGYVHFICMADGDGTDQWLPLSVAYGMPLFDASLNKQVCAAIETRGLFRSESIEQQSVAMRRLSVRLLHFISDWAGPSALSHDCPLPSRVITFSGSELS